MPQATQFRLDVFSFEKVESRYRCALVQHDHNRGERSRGNKVLAVHCLHRTLRSRPLDLGWTVGHILRQGRRVKSRYSYIPAEGKILGEDARRAIRLSLSTVSAVYCLPPLAILCLRSLSSAPEITRSHLDTYFVERVKRGRVKSRYWCTLAKEAIYSSTLEPRATSLSVSSPSAGFPLPLLHIALQTTQYQDTYFLERAKSRRALAKEAMYSWAQEEKTTRFSLSSASTGYRLPPLHLRVQTTQSHLDTYIFKVSKVEEQWPRRQYTRGRINKWQQDSRCRIPPRAILCFHCTLGSRPLDATWISTSLKVSKMEEHWPRREYTRGHMKKG